MKASIETKLQFLTTRHQELSQLLSQGDVVSDQNRFRDLSREYSKLEPVVACYREYTITQASMSAAKDLLEDSDPEMRAFGTEEIEAGKLKLEQLEQQLQVLLLPEDPNDGHNVFLEIRAGAGGDEAAIFVGDLLRMYTRFAEEKGWRIETISESAGEHGGYKEVISRVVGDDVYSNLKFESGAHRVQRVPATEAQGRIHTSTCTVAVLPEADEVESFDINPADLRVDTYRSSGAGGQHVNTTDSAIRITHIPTGVVVECQDERSQHKNRARAMSLLQSRLLAAEREKQQKQQTEARRNLVGTGDRSERIRTYNYPQGRVTDHRINLTLYHLAQIMEGNMGDLISALISEHQADLLSALGE